jgi:hypothetical protein
MHRKPLFWIALIALVIISCMFIYRYGNRVFFFDLKITMNAKSSKAETIKLAKSQNLKLEGYKSSAAFLTDENFQNYAELKCGGRKAFTKVLDSGIYHPIYWYVRLFKPGETREFNAYYTPTGKLLSFYEKIPETEKGAALPRNEAQNMAETEAVQKWKLDLKPYKLIEAKADTKPNGRIDHSFVYERTDAKLGEALYRLNLTISGNRLTSLHHFVKVPDKFLKEFEEMRSYNETLASVASGVMQLVYIVGLIIWFVLLLRQKKLIFAPPLRWGIVIAIFMILGSLNFFSFFWLDYDTSSSAGGFMAEQIAQILLSALFMGALAWFTILVAEALTREAFPNQVQFWRLADKDVASSKDVLSKVLVGYLLFPLQLAYVVGFYGLMGSRFGWWAPSGVMSDPNILSTFMPFISAIGNALQPGFWEEALFRALPLATCAILGRKYDKRGLFLVLGMIIQVLVFSAGHANYPQQPFYFRLVELIIPSLIFAFAYIYFGLVTGVILHFTFDAVMMNLSALLSTAPGMNLDRILFFLFLLVPLWVVLIQKIRNSAASGESVPILAALFGGWGEVPENKLNKNFGAPPLSETKKEPETEPEPSEPEINTEPAKENIVRDKFERFLLAVIIGFLLINFAPFARDETSKIRISGNEFTSLMENPRLEISATFAKELATANLKRILAEQGKAYPKEHKAYADAYRSSRDEIYLVLQDPKDHTAYSQLRNKYFFTDGWEIQFKLRKGTLDEKGESYSIFLTPKGDFVSYLHQLPESRAGATLSEDAAREIVKQAILEQYPARLPFLKEISVNPSKLPKRTDWVFTYEDSLTYGLKEGKARMDFTVRGDELAGIKTYVFIPEKTQRQFDKQSQLADILRFIGHFLVIGFLIFAAVQCILAFSRMQIDKRVLLRVFLMLALLYLARFVSTWNLNEGEWFNPIQPYGNQLITYIISLLVGFIFQNGFIAALAAMAFYNIHFQYAKPAFSRKIAVLGPLLVGVMILFESPRITDYFQTPDWTFGLADFGFLAVLQKTVTNFWLFFGLAVLIFELFKKWTANYTKRHWLPVVLSFVAGYGMVFRLATFYWEPQQLIILIKFVLLSGFMVWGASYLYSRCKPNEALLAAVIIYAGSLLNKFFYPVYPWQGAYSFVSYLIILLLVWLIYRRTRTHIES